MWTYLWTVARAVSFAMVFTFVVSRGSVVAQELGIESGRAPEWRAVSRALRLVPVDRRVRVALIDPDLAPDAEAVARLDAFIVKDTRGRLRPVIYINRRSPLVQRASAGERRAVEELAAVIHHEVRHLAGDSEAEARCAERRFLQSIVGLDQTRAEPLPAFRP
jgi:hypothetical protein